MALPFLLSALPAAFQIGAGLLQGNQADKVRVQDTRTDSFKEALAFDRQRANSQRFAGQSNAENRINQGAANALNVAMQSGTGASGVLAAATRINQNQNNAFNQLADRAQSVQQQNQDRLRGTLQQDAQWQARDRETAARERAALTQGSAQNLFGGLSTLGTVGAFALGGGFNTNPTTGTSAYASNLMNQTQIPTNGGMGYDPNQQMPIGVGQWGRLRSGNTGRWY